MCPYIDGMRCGTHLLDLRQVSLLLVIMFRPVGAINKDILKLPYLFDQQNLKHYQHYQCEDTVIPVLIKTPQANTEHLHSGRGKSNEQIQERNVIILKPEKQRMERWLSPGIEPRNQVV